MLGQFSSGAIGTQLCAKTVMYAIQVVKVAMHLHQVNTGEISFDENFELNGSTKVNY